MILVVGQNSAWQNTYYLSYLRRGKVNRIDGTFASGAGKGLNLARCLQTLGEDVHLLGYAGGITGKRFSEACASENIPATLVQISSETRTCTTLIDGERIATEIIEPAPTIDRAERDRFHEAFSALIEKASLLAIAGTALTGESDDCYLSFTNHAKKLGIPVVLDAYRRHGTRALDGRPDVLKINEDELADLSGDRVGTLDERSRAACKLIERYGLVWVIVTRGEHGAEGYDSDHGVQVVSPGVEVVNTIGSGDAFSAGVTASLLRYRDSDPGGGLEEAVLLGTAMGTANAMSVQTGSVDPKHLELVRGLVRTL